MFKKVPSGLWAALISVAIVTVYHFTFNSPKIGREAKEQDKTTGQKQQDVSVAPPKQETEPPKVAQIDTSDEQSITAMAKQVTVVINGQNPGSGVIVGKKDKTYSVLTAAHVVATQDEYEIITADGTKHSLDYRTVKKVPNMDLAVVEFTSNKNYPIAKMGNSNEGTEGATIYISGWPHPGKAITQRIFQITSGKISGRSLGAAEQGYELVYTNITRSGMSGGGIFDYEGRLIGIHGRAEGEQIYNPDTEDTVDVKSGFNLGIPINIFYEQAELTILPANPSLVSLFKEWGNGFHENNQESAALTYYQKVLAIAPEHYDANLYIGFRKYERGEVDAAIQVWEKTVQLYPDRGLPQFALAVALYDKGDRKRGFAIASTGMQLGIFNEEERFWGERFVKISTQLKQHFLPDKTFSLSPAGSLAQLNPQNTRIAISSSLERAQIIKLIDLKSGQEIRQFSKQDSVINVDGEEGILGSINPFAFSPDGKILAGGFRTNNGKIRSVITLWDVASGQEIRTFLAKGDLHSIAFSPDGKILAGGVITNNSDENVITLWDVASGQAIRTLAGTNKHRRYQGTIGLLTFSQDGQMIVSCDRDGILQLWNLGTSSELRKFNQIADEGCYMSSNPKWQGFTLSPDGKTIAVKVLNDDKKRGIKLMNISNGQEIRTITWPSNDDLKCFAFSSDGKTLAGIVDDFVILWDVRTGRERRSFMISRHDCDAIDFQPDGQTLTTFVGGNIYHFIQ